MSPPVADLTKQQFDRLRVLVAAGKTNDGRTIWLCECKCGQLTTATVSALRGGDKRSCGCLRRETGRTNLAAARAARQAR